MPALCKTEKSKHGLYIKARRGCLVLVFPVYLEKGNKHESIQEICGESSTGGKPETPG